MGIRFDLGSIEDYVAGHLRMFIFGIAGLVLFVGLLAISVFFIAVQGAEQTMVPNVVGKELTEALMELQVKELYPRLQLRYSESSHDRGHILEQEPNPGSIVKAGKRIRLVVSQGAIINKVENYLGRDIDEVRMDLQTLYAESGGLTQLSIREPISYDFSSEKPGTILAQDPEHGVDISGPMSLKFIVSKGREYSTVTVPQLTNLTLTEALTVISNTGINFEFIIKNREGSERGESVVSQSPQAGNNIPVNSKVQITVATPERLAAGEVFGLFRYTMPMNPYPLTVRLEAQRPAGERIRLFTSDFPGGTFTVPYKQPAGTVLIFSMLNRELYRETVGSN
jgi:beta-lactam-binding protein with PASTA domain